MRYHVLPIGDLEEHDEAIWCWCKPSQDGDVIVHNSADCREHYESNHIKSECQMCTEKEIKKAQAKLES